MRRNLLRKFLVGRVGFEPTKAEPADFINPKVSFWHGLYLYPRRVLWYLVSTAPQLNKLGSHGIGIFI